MNKDLKLIKKYYGEDLMHYCRDNFPTLVEENKMFELLNGHFQHNKCLYNDLKENNLFLEFNNFIMKLVNNELDYFPKIDKTPFELMSDAGYILYECKSEKDIQSFKKYYASGEELCTFHGGRLNRCHVFFAVKKDVENIKRENFKKPKRQDEYGTSVISIQFTKDASHTLSIKNRYNHKVNNPDNTFNNNLDNIIEGLTYSFAKYYGLKQKNINSNFEIPNYVFVSNKYYKYNIEKYGIYYCIDNVIIGHDKPEQYDKEKYIIMDDFILDLVNKEIIKHSSDSDEDAFLTIPRNAEKVDVTNTDYGKRVTLFNKDKTFEVILLNKENSIIGYVNNFVKSIGDYFLFRNVKLRHLELDNVLNIGDYFLEYNEKLKHLELNNVLSIADYFLECNEKLKHLELNNVLNIGDYFLECNENLKQVKLRKVTKIGDCFMSSNHMLCDISLPNCEEIGNDFLRNNECLKEINFPNLKTIGDDFIMWNESIKEVYLLNLLEIGTNFLKSNLDLKKLYIPKCINIEDIIFLRNNVTICEMLISLELSKNIFTNYKKIKNVFVLNDNNEIKALKNSIFNPIYNKTLIKSLKKLLFTASNENIDNLE